MEARLFSSHKYKIDELASLVHPRDGHWRNRFVMVEAYFDESGIHDGASVCVVGGFYGMQMPWRKFERQWNKIIADYPELKGIGFHARRFFARTPHGERVSPYKDWSDEKADKFLERLVQAIMRNSIYPIGYGVIVADFMGLSLNERKWLTGAKFTIGGKCLSSGNPKKPYYIPFQFCVLDSSRMSKANPADKIHFFVGLDRTFHEYASGLYKYIISDQVRLPEKLRNLLGQISYPMAKDTAGLQAADLLAYQLYQYALKANAAGKNIEPTLLLKQLLYKRLPKQRFDLFDAKRFAGLIAQAKDLFDKITKM